MRPSDPIHGMHGMALFGAGALILPGFSALGQSNAQQPFDWFFHLLANPNVAYALLVIGLLGLIGELASAGAIVPGAFGAISLILSFVAFGQLPTNWAGVALIAAGMVMFLVDIKIAGHGLSIAGALAFIFGSMLVFTPFWVPVAEGDTAVRLSPWLIIATTAGVTAFFGLVVNAAIRAQFVPVAMGQHTLLGKIGVVRQALAPEGIVHVDGEEWSAESVDGLPIPLETRVVVIAVDGLRLKVRPADRPARGAAKG